jgi:hypothetical protein
MIFFYLLFLLEFLHGNPVSLRPREHNRAKVSSGTQVLSALPLWPRISGLDHLVPIFRMDNMVTQDCSCPLNRAVWLTRVNYARDII